MSTCPICRGRAFPLGQLGNRMWMCCRYCGWQFDVDTNTTNEGDDDV
jgi:hypothetical protein